MPLEHGRILKRPLELVDRAVCENELNGFIKLFVDQHHTIHGANIVCQSAGEMINELAVCMHHGIKVRIENYGDVLFSLLILDVGDQTGKSDSCLPELWFCSTANDCRLGRGELIQRAHGEIGELL